ncbi:MAG: protein kinase [Alphaproteobacteria bacterium]|nr:protein kinase [Alphaproteobacteria bacterium]
MDARPTPPSQLERLGRYRIVRPLSKGGMALVYEARRESLAGVSPRVAIKLILPEHQSSATFKELFINEARLGASMQHQNLVGIQDFDCEGDTYFLVMEFVEGLTLRRIIGLCQKHRIGIPLGVIAEIGRQSCDGLHYAHSAKDDRGRHLRLVHRDIKPSNLILNPQGVVKVLDFGISKGRLRKERSGSVKGTWGYMAPEQAHGHEVWPSADVFGLAVVLFELASLRPMFHNKGKDEIKQLLADDHAARMAATLDPHYAPLVGVLVRALQRDARARFESAEEFGRALSALLPDPITARDEVVRFFETLEAFDRGAPPVANQPTHPSGVSVPHSLVAFPATGGSSSGARHRAGWFLTGAVSTVLVTLFVALSAIVLVLLYRDFVVQPVEAGPAPAVRLAPAPKPEPVVEEPPGPAGVGAPGEVPKSERPVPAPEPPPDPEPEPVRVQVVRPKPPVPTLAEPVPQPMPGPVQPVAAVPDPAAPIPIPVPVAADTGTLAISAVQRAEVYIAGQFVQYAPVTRELPPGRYAVSIVAMDGRRRTFEVEIEAGATIRRNWDFDRMEWR